VRLIREVVAGQS